jgi:hypothetical protein
MAMGAWPAVVAPATIESAAVAPASKRVEKNVRM